MRSKVATVRRDKAKVGGCAGAYRENGLAALPTMEARRPAEEWKTRVIADLHDRARAKSQGAPDVGAASGANGVEGFKDGSSKG